MNRLGELLPADLRTDGKNEPEPSPERPEAGPVPTDGTETPEQREKVVRPEADRGAC